MPVSEPLIPDASFDRRSVHSSRCLDRVWDDARQAAQSADCSMSTFHEVALQLLTQVVREQSIKIEGYDPKARWIGEVLNRVKQP